MPHRPSPHGGSDPKRLALRAIATGLLVTACGAKHTQSAPDVSTPVVIDPTECPTTRESSSGKIAHEPYLLAHTDQTQSVSVILRPIEWTNPACASANASPACPGRDQALQERQALNAKQVECVLAAFGPPDALGAIHAEWYEQLQTTSTGSPVPIGVAFSVLTIWSQLEGVAQHPYVERIEPAPGQPAKLGVAAPPISSECPAATDAPEPKLTGAASIAGQGRKPVAIALNQALLPALRTCSGEAVCDEQTNSGWQLTVASTRQRTCVRRYIDTKLTGNAPDVAYGSIEGVPQGPGVPPFGEAIHATLEFGLGLTWDEAVEAAKLPSIQGIRTWEGLSYDDMPDGCPPDYDTPIVAPQCTSETDNETDKFTAAAAASWQASGGPNNVMIAVRRLQKVCPLPACPGRAAGCPELDRYLAWMNEVSVASQSCVRTLIAAIGGTVSDDVSPAGFFATLTWSQIQTVAVDPDVISITPNVGAPLP